MNVKQLIQWKGELNRREYLLWGVLLFAVKYNLDRFIAKNVMDRNWYITDYFIQADRLTVQQLSELDIKFYLIMLAISLPFIWFGTVLCVKRLRNAKLPAWLVIFFFIPFVNFILFLLLSAVPARSEGVEIKENFLSRLIPKSKSGSAMFAVAVVLVISLALAGLLINYLKDYGWSAFVGIPFFLGFGSVLIFGYHRTLTLRQAFGVAFFAVLFFNVIIFILALEGIICLAMAAPIVFPIGLIGALIGYAVHDRQKSAAHLFTLPAFMIVISGFTEHLVDNQPPLATVVSRIEIKAPKQAVWDQLVAFSSINEPTEFLFKTGIAYPTHAEITGEGAGAVRKCNFTTGPFIEPITIWNEPDLLEFSVLDQPPPMLEWSIYKDLQIAHLNGYFKSTKGQFKLETLPNGNTLLIGTTWYHHDIWPSMYWKLWSDFILHRIHMRVLTHIKTEAERL